MHQIIVTNIENNHLKIYEPEVVKFMRMNILIKDIYIYIYLPERSTVDIVNEVRGPYLSVTKPKLRINQISHNELYI